ncbi:membrane dipeptidase [Agrobacterium vitis]|nr:membrane dipeptidase [Agrobacterium vitis]
MDTISSENMTDSVSEITDLTVKALHTLAYPIDTHLDSLFLSRLAGYDFWKGDWKAHRRSLVVWLIRKTSPRGRNRPLSEHVSGPDFLEGGYGGACFSAHALWENLIPAPFLDPWKNWVAHQRYVEDVVDQSQGRMRLARNAKEVRAAQAVGKRCAILSMEGAHMLGPGGVKSQALRLDRLGEIARAGAAYLTLNHFSHTDISEAGYAPVNPWRKIEGGGLSAFGRQVVERCIDVGLLVDVTHTSTQGILDACEICVRRHVPAFASHGASRTVTRGGEERPSRHLDRALSDEAIRAIVRTGGCISVILAPYFLQNRYLADGKPDMDADIAFVIGYYEAFAQLIASMEIVEDPWKHLSFGSDFDGGISSLPTGMQSGADLPKLTEAMVAAGWPEQRIIDVYSGNFLRVWQQVRP